MALTNCSMCYLQLPEDKVISHVVRCHKYDPNFIIYCNQPGCGSSYKKWSSFQIHVKRVHQINLDNIDDENDENIADVAMDVPQSNPNQDERNKSGKLLTLHLNFATYFYTYNLFVEPTPRPKNVVWTSTSICHIDITMSMRCSLYEMCCVRTNLYF